jgi:hypothetical protein
MAEPGLHPANSSDFEGIEGPEVRAVRRPGAIADVRR